MEEKELEAEKTENPAGIYTHVLSAPFTWEGNTYESLVFDFGSLTGADSLAVEEELQNQGKALIISEFSGSYLVRVAARACKTYSESGGRKIRVGADALRALPIRDYNRIIKRVRAFLLATA